MSEKTILIWFRNDLRIHDNEILIEAVKRAGKVVPVYCFDPRYFAETKFGTAKTGVFRARFLLESVNNLRNSLRRLGGDLIVKTGKPEDILPEICRLYHVREVYHHREVGPEETAISALVEEALWKQQINLKHFIGHTLYHKEDLPFPIRNIPNDFMVFRKKIERDSTVRSCFETPGQISVPENLQTGNLPELSDLITNNKTNLKENLHFIFKGGEDEGLKYLRDILNSEKVHKNNRVVSARLSPWLSMGCISSREVFMEAKKHHKQLPDLYTKIIAELQWRDYFRFMLKKHGNIMPDGEDLDRGLSRKEKKKFEEWKAGNTGNEIIDACMRQLNASGYLNEMCRQCTATYLVNNLRISWTAGAAYFEEITVDFSAASNWGVWASALGKGVLAANRPVIIKYSEIAQDEDIKKWLKDYNNISPAE